MAFIFSIHLPSYAWKVVADFEGKAHGERAVGARAFNHSSNDKIDTGFYRSGRGSAKLDIKDTDKGAFGRWGGVIDFPMELKAGDELWFSVDTYFPEGFDVNASPFLKFLRVRTPSGHNDLYIANTRRSHPLQYIYEGQQTWTYIDTDPITYGRWESYQVYMKFDTRSVDEGGQGLVRVWRNGNLLSEITSTKTLKTAQDTATYALLFTYWNGEKPPTQHMWVDNVILTNDTPQGRDSQGNPLISIELPDEEVVPLPSCPSVTCACSCSPSLR